MTSHKVRVVLGPAGKGHVWIDGVEVPRLTRVRVEASVREPTRVLVEMIAVDAELEILDAEVETRNES